MNRALHFVWIVGVLLLPALSVTAEADKEKGADKSTSAEMGGHHGHGWHGHHGRHGHHGHHGWGRHHGHHGGHWGRRGHHGAGAGMSRLKLTDEQKKKVAELRKKMAAEFESILTPEQKKTFEEMKKARERHGRPGAGNQSEGKSEKKPESKPAPKKPGTI